MQTAGQITYSMSANVTYESNLHGDYKARKLQRNLMSLSSNKTARDKILSVIFSTRVDAMQLRSEDLEENWTVFRKAVDNSSAFDTLGHTFCKQKDWPGENRCFLKKTLLTQSASIRYWLSIKEDSYLSHDRHVIQ